MDEDKDIVQLETANLNFNFLNSLSYTSDVKRKLSQYLSSVVKGSNEVYLTPLGKNNDPDKLLSMVDEIIDNGSDLLSEPLKDLEHLNRLKYGPRSIAKPWKDRKDSLLSYYNNDSNSEDFKFIHKDYNNLRPISIDNAIKLLKNNSNSGLPYLSRKGSIKDRLKSDYYESRGDDPCVLFTRTQESGKTRNVWGYPVLEVLNDLRFYEPLMNHQKKSSYRNALKGTNYVDAKLSNLVINSKLTGKKILSIDFSSYDASISTSLQKACFDYIKQLFQYSYSEEIDKIYVKFNTIGIISPDGVLKGSHGVPSGATFTNEVDSLAQFLIAKFSGLSESDFDIQGDDGAYILNDDEYKKLTQNFKRFGLNVNVEKSYYNEDYAVYLQKLYDIYYINKGLIGGIYPIYRAINRLVYQETYTKFEDYDIAGRDYYSIRSLTILENCKYHPLFEPLVKLVYKLDKFKLAFSQKELIKVMDMENKLSSSVGQITNQYGDDIKGIYSFESYKLIKKFEAQAGST